MKRCVNIQPTEDLVWNTLVDLLTNTEELKNSLDKVLTQNPDFSVLVRKQRLSLIRKIEDLEKNLKRITEGIVDLEKKRILNQFHTEDIYLQIKKKLDIEYKGIHLKIEDNKNLLSFHYQKDKWYKSMLEISKVFTKNKTFSFQQKKEILTHFIQSITLSYQTDKKVHEITLFLKIPLIFEGVKHPFSKNVPRKNLRKPSKTLKDQPNTRSFYSTVTESLPLVNTDTVIGNNITPNKVKNNNRSYYLTMEVRITSSNLWLSHYSDYQMELYSIISDLHDNQNMTFKQISDYLIEKGYKTPRNKVFNHKHVWSIYTKKNRSDQRFGRSFQPDIIDVGLDIINYNPS
jgi:hypothetical protein